LRKIPPTPFAKGVREGGITGKEREVCLLHEIWYRKMQAWQEIK
jgi:hypothetical protein